MTDYISPFNQKKLNVIKNPFPSMKMIQKHVIYLPILCPKTQNPKAGSTLTIKYHAQNTLLELFSLESYIQGYIAHQIVRDLEYFVGAVAKDCAQALGYGVTVKANIQLEGLNQAQKIKVIID